MPELPEVETIRAQLAERLPGATISSVWTFGTPKFDQAPHALGARVRDVRRRGKYLLIGLDHDRELAVHLGMTGSIELTGDRHVSDAHDSVNGDATTRWCRARWGLDDGRTLWLHDPRRFGRIAVVATGDHATLPTLAAMGPEPFAAAFTPEHLHRGLTASRRPVKTRLLDQRLVAGVGNIYADEALWRAGINPASRRVGAERARRLHRAIVEVLGEAIEHGGTRLRDYRSVDGDTGAHQFHLDCYGRAGEPCNRCRTPLRRRDLDGRGTTWCPSCQRS